ncbi:MAG: hypothetical protein RMJ59_01265 [Candidatus Nitrosocaldus sp.]|nr:hypothetical protein [Candidatus Nitrosocaldus sp.]MDW8274994.1 hypothetical protein [Candidatus Nitrosocaldus sp.]
MKVTVYILATVIVLGIAVTVLSSYSAADDKPRTKNIWDEYSVCDVDALQDVVREQIRERYPFDVKLAFPTYIPEGYRLIAMDFVVDGPDTPNGYVKLIYWDKGDCSILYRTGEDALYALHGGFGYIIDLPREEHVPKGMNDIAVGEALAEYQARKDSILAPMQEVRLSNGYRALGWEPFMGASGMAMTRCPESEGKTVKDVLIDDADNVTCTYDDGTVAEGYITYSGKDKQAGMVTYWHEEYNLGITVRGGLPLEELARIAGSVKVQE